MRRAGVLGIGCALWLAACGGGSSGGSDAPPQATIDAGSAPVITADVMRGMELSGEFAAIAGSTGPSTSLNSLGAAVALGVSVAPAVTIPPTTDSCPFFGTVHFSGDVAAPGTFTPGDRVELDFFNCVLEMGGPRLGGSFDFTVQSFSGDVDGAFSLRANGSFDDFTLTENFGQPDQLVRKADGNAVLSQDTQTPNILALELQTGPITLSEDEIDISLRSFDNLMNQNVNDDPIPYELAGAGTLNSSRFTGRVDYTTLDAFEGVAPDQPVEGEMEITGAQNATITVLPEGGDDVTLELDLDGDDDVDQTVSTTWTAIFAAELPPGP